MKNLVLRVSVKFGLILGGINIAFGLINTLAYNPGNLSQLGASLTAILSFILMITCLAMAHYEFNKKNDNHLSFKDAIVIGLLVLGISYVISTIYAIVNLKIIMNEVFFSLGTYIISSFLGFFIQIVILFVLITFESQWKIFTKSGKKGWASIIPVYNIIVLLEIVKKPVWWLIMLIIPLVNIVFAIWITNLLSKRFGKDEGYTIGLIFLPIIFYPLLGLSKAEYIDE